MKTKTKIILIIALAGIIAAVSLIFTEKAGYENSNITSTMKITSPSFQNNTKIPPLYTCDNKNINPPLQISDVPKDAKSLTLIVDDPDASSGSWVHWTVWNIDPTKTGIAENSVPGVEGITSFGIAGYGGPCPPSGTHRYVFKLYALNTLLDIPTYATPAMLEKAMEGHILAQSELVGLYSRL